MVVGAARNQMWRMSHGRCRVDDATRQPMQLKLDKNGTPCQQIARAIRQAVLDGRMVAQSRLPSASALAAELAVSRPCVQRAYRLLCAEGFAVAKRSLGTRVATAMPPVKI